MRACADALESYPAELLPAVWWAEANAEANGFGGVAEGIDLIGAVWFGPAATAQRESEDRQDWLRGRLRRLVLQVRLLPDRSYTYTTVLNSRWDRESAAELTAALRWDHLARQKLLPELESVRDAINRFIARLAPGDKNDFRADLGQLVQQIVNYCSADAPTPPEAEEPPEAASTTGTPVADVFVQIDGVAGESTDERHRDWIQARSYRHTMGPSTPAIHIEKLLDRASPKLYEACSSGRRFPRVLFEICRRAPWDSVLLLRVELEDAVISSITQSTAPGESGVPMEEITFRYGAVRWVYTQYGLDRMPEGVVATSSRTS
jgi:type VI secretion system secreted protein Hcp